MYINPLFAFSLIGCLFTWQTAISGLSRVGKYDLDPSIRFNLPGSFQDHETVFSNSKGCLETLIWAFLLYD
jgi:hypothetical protein